MEVDSVGKHIHYESPRMFIVSNNNNKDRLSYYTNERTLQRCYVNLDTKFIPIFSLSKKKN